MYVSVVIPTFNRKNSLNKTLQSLINQNYPQNKYEIIVCDDGSTDDTPALMKSTQNGASVEIKYFVQANSGPASARNLGIREAKGEIIGFIDDDCIAVPDWINSTLKHFGQPKIGGVQGPTLQISKIPLRKKVFNYARTANVTKQDYSYASCNIFYRKDILDAIKGFDSNFPVPCWGEDTDLGNRIALRGYDIVFDDDVKVFHDIQYIPFYSYLRSLKKYSSRALLIKRYPFMRKRFPLKIIGVKSHVYPIFIILSILAYIISKLGAFSDFYLSGAIALTFVFYLWGRVTIDSNYKLYPMRLALFLRYLLLDTVGLYYTLKGCVRYKTILL